MNKYLIALLILLFSLLIFMGLQGSGDSSIEVEHPLYDNQEIEEILVTTYHSINNIEQSSWDELISDRGFDEQGNKILIDVVVQQLKDGRVCLTCLGYGVATANAEITQRGQSSRLSPQKSFKIRYFPDATDYYGENELNLKKHYDDELRIKNKLIFDLIKEIPNTLVSNTKFVHLYVRDLVGGNPEIVDMGLFTHHEEVDENFFIRRDLDPDGNLYNVNFFDFYRYEDAIKLETDPDFSKKAFEEYLEINGSKDHTELINLLDAIDSDLMPINSVINTYFDRDNYLTYLAINMLTDNIDGSARNFKLYSPSDSKYWYFIYWDLDKTFLPETAMVDQWRSGIHLYMNDALHSEFLKLEYNRQELIDKVSELRTYFSEDKVDFLVNEYDIRIKDVLTTSPDMDYLIMSYDELIEEALLVPDKVEENYQMFLDSINYPKAVFIYDFERKSDYYILDWSDSYDFENESIEYSVKIATDPDMLNVVLAVDNIKDSQLPIFELEAGNYFVSIISTNESGYSMQSYDRYKDSLGYIYLGVKNLVVE